ncbi:iron transporter [Halorussus salinisoli]|uniref:iron transporter n=1 Tax=Halorussus salinisoli TaxID=2558242 RepID=UPI0010C1E9B3|nr:iron transporter [Halorussus salinisoli]
MPDNPEKQTSDEVDQTQLDLAEKAGDAYREALDYMANEVAHTGDKQETGDYLVGFAQEEAEGMYVLKDEGQFEFVEPDDANCHLEVAVCDADDGRFVPGCTVIATLTGEDGERVGPTRLPLLWHPGLYHYGKNLDVPGDGTYDIDVRVEPPTFKRHDEQNGDRYGEPAEVTFENVDVETGQ